MSQEIEEVAMSEDVNAAKTKSTGIVLQPEEGHGYWQPIWANGYSIVKLSPKHAGPENLTMGIQVIAPGGYVREHSHTPNQEILFCFAGRGTILVDGKAHPFVPGTTVYAGPGVQAQNHQ
jgi:quercetin dioxygenase-like cupin family protein